MVFTKDDMDAFQPKFTGMFAVFLPSALKSLAKYTCDAFEPESEGVVHGREKGPYRLE